MTNKEFAQNNMGKRFLKDNELCRIVGYDPIYIIIEFDESKEEGNAWDTSRLFDGDYVDQSLEIKSGKVLLYVDIDDLFNNDFVVKRDYYQELRKLGLTPTDCELVL